MKVKINSDFKKRYMNSKKKPDESDIETKAGTEVEIIADHGNILIAEHRGERFSIKTNLTNYESHHD